MVLCLRRSASHFLPQEGRALDTSLDVLLFAQKHGDIAPSSPPHTVSLQIPNHKVTCCYNNRSQSIMNARYLKVKKSIRAFKPVPSKDVPEVPAPLLSHAKRISLSILPPAPPLNELHLKNGRTVKQVEPGHFEDCAGETGYVADVDRKAVPRDKSIPKLHLGLPVVALPRFNIQPSTPDEGESDTMSAVQLPSAIDEIPSPSPSWQGWDDIRGLPSPSIFSPESFDGTSSFEGSTLFSRSNSITSATTMRSSLPPDSLTPSPVKRGDKPLKTRTTDYHSFVYSPSTATGNQLPTIKDILGDESESEAEEEEEEYHLPIIKPLRRNWVNFSFRNNSEFLPVD